jgi:hypothetical protein
MQPDPVSVSRPQRLATIPVLLGSLTFAGFGSRWATDKLLPAIEPQIILIDSPLAAVLGDLNMQIKKAYLTLAFVGVTIFGLPYGISPTWQAVTFLNITDLNPNVAHVMRASRAFICL